MDEIQYASERDLAIRNVDRDSRLLRTVKAALYGSGVLSGAFNRKRWGRSGFAMNNLPNATASAIFSARACVAVSRSKPLAAINGPWNACRSAAKGTGTAPCDDFAFLPHPPQRPLSRAAGKYPNLCIRPLFAAPAVSPACCGGRLREPINCTRSESMAKAGQMRTGLRRSARFGTCEARVGDHMRLRSVGI